MYFDYLLVFAGVVIGCRSCSFAKEAETHTILYAMRKAKDLEIFKVHFFTDTMEIIKVIMKVDDL